MARASNFFPKQVYMGGASNLVNLSEIFEVTEEYQIDLLELRVWATNPSTLVVTGTIVTTSDPTFVDATWKTLSGTFVQTGAGITIVLGLSALGRFVRAKLDIPASGFACVCMNAVAREV